ncbi:MAG: Uncharacterized protein AUK63_403 [bacterium P3]|nr:MAG: Uncharacterized protein AUK63_403 [bacterium P3]KWW42637.1 MAG: Uncharacterized protein F083_41 [bacterium F083]
MQYGTLVLNRMANGVANIVGLLREYEKSNDTDYLVIAAYFTRLTILDSFEEYGYNPMNFLYANIDGSMTKLSFLQVNMMTYGKITDYTEHMVKSDKEYIDSILDKEDAFYEIDKQIPLEKKKIMLG